MKIIKLNKKHYKINGGSKYFIDCSVSDSNYIIPTDFLKNTRDISILKAVINYSKFIKKNKHIVIKIAHKDKTNKKEYDISEKLKTINGFIKYTCLFNCFDDTFNYIDINKQIPEKICTAENKNDYNNNILIAPYINLGSIRNYKWTLENIYILKSLLKQCVISLMEAYINYGFLHNDLHLDNILFKKTKMENIKYKDIELKSEGYKIVIMDFDSSFIGVDINKEIQIYWNDLYNVFCRIKFDLIKIIIPINNNIILNILEYNISKSINPNKTLDLLELIDKLEFSLPKSTPLKYNPNVF